MRASPDASGGGPAAVAGSGSAPPAHGAKDAIAATATQRSDELFMRRPDDLPKKGRILPAASDHQLPDAPPPPELPPPPENPPPPDEPPDEPPPDEITMPPIVADPLVFICSAAFAYHGIRLSTSLAIGYPMT